jgi:hypothetical protein
VKKRVHTLTKRKMKGEEDGTKGREGDAGRSVYTQ